MADVVATTLADVINYFATCNLAVAKEAVSLILQTITMREGQKRSGRPAGDGSGKRRGRPKGSKNAPKAAEEVAAEVGEASAA